MVDVGLKQVGGILVVLAVIILFLMVWFIDTLSQMNADSCTCGDSCGMTHFEIPFMFYVGIFGVCLIFFIGIALFVKGGSLLEQDSRDNWDRNLQKLDDEERIVYKLLMDNEGTLFQSEIAEKSGLSKVKVTRILDKLESRRMAERRRRGLTNIVVLK